MYTNLLKSRKSGQSPRAEGVTETGSEAESTENWDRINSKRATLYKRCKALMGWAVASGVSTQPSTETYSESRFQLGNILWAIESMSVGTNRSLAVAQLLSWTRMLAGYAGDGTISVNVANELKSALHEALDITAIEVEGRRRLEKSKLQILRSHGGITPWKWQYREPAIKRLISMMSSSALCDISRKTASHQLSLLNKLVEAGKEWT
jgi:hypothetical protein